MLPLVSRKEAAPRADPGHVGEITSPTWLGNAPVSSQRRWWKQSGRGWSGAPLLAAPSYGIRWTPFTPFFVRAWETSAHVKCVSSHCSPCRTVQRQSASTRNQTTKTLDNLFPYFKGTFSSCRGRSDHIHPPSGLLSLHFVSDSNLRR